MRKWFIKGYRLVREINDVRKDMIMGKNRDGLLREFMLSWFILVYVLVFKLLKYFD